MDTGEHSYTAGDTRNSDEGIAYGLGFTFILFFILTTLYYASHVCNRSIDSRSPAPPTSGDDHHCISFCQGLADDVLVTFPTFVYSDAKGNTDAATDAIVSGCAICLADYRPADVLRLLPECGHLFHLKCVDTWLKVHPTCPVCRSSPLQTPVAGMVPVAVPRS